MTLTVNIKSKKSNIPGGYPSWNITVSGRNSDFTPSIEKYLYTHGLSPLSVDGMSALWSSRYTIDAPALYIAGRLKTLHRAILRDDTAKMYAAAISEHEPEDGLEKFLGRTAGISAGQTELRVRAAGRDYIANCDDSDGPRRALLEGAGFLPIVEPNDKLARLMGTRPYRTRDPLIASNLEYLMDENAKSSMRVGLAKAMKKIAASKSQKAPEDFNVPVPDGLDYLPFQKGGIQQVLDEGESAIIADDMGLGKTIQGIGILNGKPEVERMLVFCQANMKIKWCREIEKWKVNQDLTVGYAEGDSFPDTDIVVINYDIAARHEEKFRAIKWGLVLTDEAHNLKNPEAKRTEAVLGNFDDIGAVPLTKEGILVHLTGTPKPNRVSELWPLLTSARPDIWGKGPEARQAFMNRYEPPVLIRKEMTRNDRTFHVTIPLPGKPKNVIELQLRLRSTGFVRRLKRDTDLPPKFRTPLEMAISLTDEDRDLLREAEADLTRITGVKSGAKVGRSERAAAIIDAIKGFSPKSPEFQEIARVRRNLGVLKAPHIADFVIAELLEDEELPKELRRKTVVFAHHKEVISEIRNRIEKSLPGSTIVYDGSVSNKKRQENIDLFQEHPDARVFIMSLAGATGITLTAAHRMRVGEPDWSPSNMVQIEDRIWRIGQEHNCDIGYLFVNNSLDVLMGNALMDKMTIDEKTINTISFAEIEEKKAKMRERLGSNDTAFLDAAEEIPKKGKAKNDKQDNQFEMTFE